MNAEFDNLTLEQLAAYLDGELEQAECAEFELRLRQEPDLAGLLQQWRDDASRFESLPHYELSDEFSLRILDSLPTNGKSMVSPATTSATSNFGSMQVFLVLAATVLLALFLAPVLIDSDPDPVANQDVPEILEPGSPDGVDAQPEQQPSPPRTMVRIPLAQRIRTDQGLRSGFVEPTPLPVRQAFVLRLAGGDADQPLERIEQQFVAHDLKQVSAVNDQDLETSLTPEGTQILGSLFLTTTPGRVKSLLEKISDQVPLTLNVKTLPVDGEPSGAATEPVEAEVDPDEAEEIESLDRWFGLTGDDNDQPQRFLILIVGESE